MLFWVGAESISVMLFRPSNGFFLSIISYETCGTPHKCGKNGYIISDKQKLSIVAKQLDLMEHPFFDILFFNSSDALLVYDIAITPL